MINVNAPIYQALPLRGERRTGLRRRAALLCGGVAALVLLGAWLGPGTGRSEADSATRAPSEARAESATDRRATVRAQRGLAMTTDRAAGSAPIAAPALPPAAPPMLIIGGRPIAVTPSPSATPVPAVRR